MRNSPFPQLAWIAAAAVLWAAAPAQGAELYVSGDLGISWFSGDGVGTNDIVGDLELGQERGRHAGLGRRRSARSSRSTRCCPGACACPGFGVPYWPGRELRFEGGDDVRFPDWETRFEVEYLRGRDAELATPSFNPLDAYRSDVEVVDGDGQAAARRADPHAGRALLGARAVPRAAHALRRRRRGHRVSPTSR